MIPTTPGTVVLTEGNRHHLVSKLVARFTDSWITHCFIVLNEREIVEAAFPRVRITSLAQRVHELTEEGRAAWCAETSPAVAEKARTYAGRFYDFGQAFLFMVTGGFINDGPGTLVCSRLITASCLAAGIGNIINMATVPAMHRRVEQLRVGWATAVDIFEYSRLNFEMCLSGNPETERQMRYGGTSSGTDQ